MADALDIVGNLVLGGVAAAYIAHTYSAAKARGRLNAGIGHLSCARCGDALPPSSGDQQATMCVACLQRTRRSYLAGAWFFGALALLFAGMAPFVIVSEYRRFGLETALKDSALLLGVTALTAGPAWAIRAAAKSLR